MVSNVEISRDGTGMAWVVSIDNITISGPDSDREKAILGALYKLAKDIEDQITWIKYYRDSIHRKNGEIEDLKLNRDKVRLVLTDAQKKFREYEMDVDTLPTDDHKRFMDKLTRLLEEMKG